MLPFQSAQTYLTFYAQSVASSHHNSKAHPSRNILVSSPQNQILNCSSCTNTCLFGLLLTFPISHQAIVMWSTRSAFKHHSPDVSRPSVFSMKSWAKLSLIDCSKQIYPTAKIFQPQPQHFNEQQTRVPCYNVSGRPDNYHLHYIFK